MKKKYRVRGGFWLQLAPGQRFEPGTEIELTTEQYQLHKHQLEISNTNEVATSELGSDARERRTRNKKTDAE